MKGLLEELENNFTAFALFLIVVVAFIFITGGGNLFAVYAPINVDNAESFPWLVTTTRCANFDFNNIQIDVQGMQKQDGLTAQEYADKYDFYVSIVKIKDNYPDLFDEPFNRQMIEQVTGSNSLHLSYQMPHGGQDVNTCQLTIERSDLGDVVQCGNGICETIENPGTCPSNCLIVCSADIAYCGATPVVRNPYSNCEYDICPDGNLVTLEPMDVINVPQPPIEKPDYQWYGLIGLIVVLVIIIGVAYSKK